MASPLLDALDERDRWDKLIGGHYRTVARTRDLNNADRMVLSDWSAKADAAEAVVLSEIRTVLNAAVTP